MSEFNGLRLSFRNAASNFADWNIRTVFLRAEIPHRGTVFSRVKNAGTGLRDMRGEMDGRKKSPLFGGLESIFLEEDRGDRKHDAALRHFRPMMSGDSSHPDGACLPDAAGNDDAIRPAGMMPPYRYTM